MTWVKGTSGNPLGRPKDKPFRTALVIELLREGPSMPALQRIAAKALEAAQDGNLEAIKFVAERLDGKAAQEINANISDERDISQLSDEQVKERIAALEQRLQRRVPVLIDIKPNGKANGHGSPQED